MAEIIDITENIPEENIYLLEDNDGNEVPFEFVDLMEYEGEEYLFLLPIEDDNGEVLNNDFYGGNFKGITEKMDYIASLGTTILYLNPVSKSFSSHRYDTGDYKTPDPMLGTEADFTAMCEEAHKHGIRVILDGVYSHTGSDSLYFNKNGTFSATESKIYIADNLTVRTEI